MYMRYCFTSLFIALLFSACSSSGGTVVEENGNRPPSFEEVLQRLPETETFDEASYPTQPPVVEVIIEHDVPEDLMAGSVGRNTSGLQRGWRIQVVFAREKMVADQAVDEMTGWLSKMRRSNPDIPVFQQPLPVYNVYLQPYFRVRIGDFTSRESAQMMLDTMIDDYPRAFIMVDQINVP